MGSEGIPRNLRESVVEETITSAALSYRGEIFRGVNHGNALDDLELAYPDYKAREVREGFVISARRFVDREEAFQIARSQGQNKGKFRETLDSNDVSYMKD